MHVLCFDIGSGGVTAARFDEKLEAFGLAETPWNLHRDAAGHATLSADQLLAVVEQLGAQLHEGPPVAAVSFACFMHSFLVMSSCCAPLSPIYTWLDSTSGGGVDLVRRQMGERFHAETGCHYHPLFPVFKLAASPAGRGNRVGSPKALLAQEIAGSFADDIGMASASGLLHLPTGQWQAELLGVTGLEAADLPILSNPYEIVGRVTAAAEQRFGIAAGTPLVNGSGDGFLANIGSACTAPARIAVTLGTSAVARQMLPFVEPDPAAGTFCYRATSDAVLLGCASSNGGNVLDWARSHFGPFLQDSPSDLPTFLPFLNGERSLEWNPNLRGSWHGLSSSHGPAELARSVAEGVMFNLAQYVEAIQQQSGVTAPQIVLSGNGFKDPALAPMLASLVSAEVIAPSSAGLASLRGTAIYAWRALGHDAMPHVEKMIATAPRIPAKPDPALQSRYAHFKQIR